MERLSGWFNWFCCCKPSTPVIHTPSPLDSLVKHRDSYRVPSTIPSSDGPIPKSPAHLSIKSFVEAGSPSAQKTQVVAGKVLQARKTP
mgnify:CR=1 FL=1